MLRDFSYESKKNLLSLVNQVENEKLSNFTDWMGDRWYEFNEYIGMLNIRNYIDNVNSYHKKIIDKNNTTKSAINKIFQDVENVDNTYSNTFVNIRELLQEWERYIDQLQRIVNPVNGNFNAPYMNKALKNVLQDIRKENIECIKDRIFNNTGNAAVNLDVMHAYLEANPHILTTEERNIVSDVLVKISRFINTCENVIMNGLQARLNFSDFITFFKFASDETTDSLTALAIRFHETYINILNVINEHAEDQNTFAASLINIINGNNSLDILGTKYAEDLKKLFGSTTFAAYLAKYTTDHSESYFAKLAAEEKNSMNIFNPNKLEKDLKNTINDFLEKHNLRIEEDMPTKYYDVFGNEVAKEDAPDYYDREFTFAEWKKEASASVSIYEETLNIGDNGKVTGTIGKAEAHGEVSAGLYTITYGEDGEIKDRKFSPGVSAEIGASVTAVEVGWDQQWAGDEMLGFNSEVDVTVGKAEAKADVDAQIFGDDGNLDLQIGASAKAEAIAGEVEVSGGINVLGGEVEASAGVSFGVGAHAEVGYRDGVFKVDAGVAVGLGVSVDFEIDIGGMIDTVADNAEAWWDGAKDAWNDFWDW